MQQLRRALLVAVLILFAAFVSRSLAQASVETLPVWLGSGVTFAALLIGARWTWPATLAGAGVALAIWGVVAHHLGPAPALVFGAIEIASMVVGVAIATLGRHDPESAMGAALLIVGALAAAALGGTLAVEFWRWQRPTANPSDEWIAWTFSTAVGLLLVAPLAVAFRGFRIKRSGGMPVSQFLGGALAFAAFIVAVLVVFADDVEQQFGDLAATLAYVPMPFLLITAVLWGPRGGAAATLLGSLLIIWKTAQGAGPFAVSEDFGGEAVIEVQGFVAIWAMVFLVARALSEGRRLALEQARAWRLRYERTLRAVGVATVEYDAVTGRATWGEGAALVLGASIAEIRTVGEWLDRIDPAERGLAEAAWTGVVSGNLPGSEQEYAVRTPDGRMQRVREQLAGVRGADGNVEQVAGLLRPATAAAAAYSVDFAPEVAGGG
jgi:integral membrane sensor domain MASE1